MSVSHIKIASLRHFTPVHFSLPFPPPPPPSANITGSRPRGKCKRDGKSETRLRFFRPESPIALGTSPLGPSSGSSSVHLPVLLYSLLIILFNFFKYAQSLGCLPSSRSSSPLPHTPLNPSPPRRCIYASFELCVQRRLLNTYQAFSPQLFKFTPLPRPCISDWFLLTQPLPYTSHCPSHTMPHISLYPQLGPFPLRDWLTMIWRFRTPSTFSTSQCGSSPCSTRSSLTSPR